MFPDNWIYIHEPGVKVGRIQNFKNWSPAMVPDPRYTVLGLEYFCFESGLDVANTPMRLWSRWPSANLRNSGSVTRGEGH